MKDVLIKMLHDYIRLENPDVLIQLQEAGKVTEYLKEKVNTINELITQLQEANEPEYVIEEVCMELLTKDLRPSKYNYIIEILEEDFPDVYQGFQQSGILPYEAANIIASCKPVFESFGFTEENVDNRQLRYAVTGTISEYLSK